MSRATLAAQPLQGASKSKGEDGLGLLADKMSWAFAVVNMQRIMV